MDDFLDFFTNRRIKLKFPINVNDSYKDIKEKIFVSYNLKNILVSENTLAITNGKKYITNDSMTNEIFKTNIIIVYTLTEELVKYILQDTNKYLDITTNSSVLSDIYNGFKNIYTGINKNDIYFTILYILDNILVLNLHKNQLQQLYIDPIYKKQQQLIIKFTTINQELVFNEADYIHLDKGVPRYSIINSIVYFPIISKNKIDKNKLIREYPVDNLVPIMLTVEEKEPIVKIHKNLSIENVTDWYLKDNKELKKINGVSFKLKINEQNYANAQLINDNRISLRMSWIAKDTVKFDDIITYTSGIQKVIKNIAKIFPNLQVKLGDPYYGFLNFQFFTKKRIPFSKINVSIKNNFTNIFKIDEAERKKEFVKFRYLPLNIVIMIRYTTDSSGKEINLIDVLGVKNQNQIISIINIVVKLLAKADIKKNVLEFKNFVFQSVDDKEKNTANKIKTNPNIDKLKDLGFTLNTISCQRERQPRKLSDSKKSSTNTIVYKENIYECPNPDYPYPGFTNKNILCCFKKNQKNKEIYKINTQGIIPNIQVDDAQILKHRIISTDKILQSNRLGLLPTLLYNIFDKDYLRLGVTNGLIGILNMATGTIKDLENTLGINELESQYNVNIIIFNINEGSILCKELYYFPHSQTVFVLKNLDNYELIVKKTNNKLCKIFKTKADITSKILDLYKKSCIVNYIGYPETPMTFADLSLTIQAQVTNKFNKVIYVLTKEAGLVPVVPTKSISGIKIVNINKLKLDANKQYDMIKNVNVKYIQISGQIINDGFTVGLVTKSGLIIPTKKSNKINNVPVVYRQFFDNIDDLIYDDKENKDQRYIYMTSVKYYQELYNRLKYTLSKRLSNVKESLEKHKRDGDNITKIIDSILKNEVTFIETTKIHNIPYNRSICTDIKDNCSVDPFCKKVKGNCLISIEYEIYKSFVDRLAIEILWNKDILTGNIISEFYGENKFIKRKNEIVLIGKDSVNKFFNKN